jgi:hypothetical protein
VATEEIVKEAEALAAKLLREPVCLKDKDGGSCIKCEGERKPTRAEERDGMVSRPYYAYDPDRLCLSCRAYWRVSLAAQDLRRLAQLKGWEAARAKGVSRGNAK